MIVDLDRFVRQGRPRWLEFETALERFERNPGAERPLAELEQFFYLYERAAADLARLQSLATPPQMRGYLESLVARGYTEVHHRRSTGVLGALTPATAVSSAWHLVRRFFGRTFPRVFRRHLAPFALACAATGLGATFGASALAVDPEAKASLMPFAHLLGDPSTRVRSEENVDNQAHGARGSEVEFSALLMTHNTRVALFSLALGMTFGAGTLAVLFYNGIILGAVVFDYLRAGEGVFLAGWLLPHGVVEIPAFLIAGQAGLLLAGALLGRGSRDPLDVRLRAIAPDLVTLCVGFGALLVWAAVIESFLSQLHQPVLPYAWKIAFGAVEAVLLVVWLARSGRGEPA